MNIFSFTQKKRRTSPATRSSFRVRLASRYALGLLVVAMAGVGLFGVSLQPKVAQADLISTLKSYFGGTTSATTSTTQQSTETTTERAATTSTASVLTGGSGSAAGASACRDGQVNVGNSGRGANATPTCQPCPKDTFKQVAGGQEACLPQGQSLQLSCEQDGYTFRTLNRAGPAGSRCCSQRATHIAGTDVGGTGVGASGLWYCGGPGSNLNDLGNSPSPTPSGATPTPTSSVTGCIYVSGQPVGNCPSPTPSTVSTPTPPAASASACPAGQVNVGNAGRGATATPTCQPCPTGTEKKTAGGQEACVPFGQTLTLSCEQDGYTFRTLNRAGPSGTRCCSGRASLIPGTNVGGTGVGASGLWVCGGGYSGGTGGATATPTPSNTGTVTPTPSGTATVSACPSGQVNVGGNRQGVPSCQPCPTGTEKMTAGGQEACRPPGSTFTLSCEVDGYTFRTVNRWGPSGTRCCSGRASLIPGTNVGGTGASASGLWVCGGNGASYGAGTRPSVTPSTVAVTATPTPSTAATAGYLATCTGGGVITANDPVIGVNVQTNGSILAAVDLRSISGAIILLNGQRVTGTTFTLQKGDVLTVRTSQGDYVATTDNLAVRESASVLIPMPCVSAAGTDASGRTLVRITPDAAFTAGLKLGEFEVWYRVRSGGAVSAWQKFDWLACASSTGSCVTLPAVSTVEAKVKTITTSALGGAGNWSLTASKTFGQ